MFEIWDMHVVNVFLCWCLGCLLVCLFEFLLLVTEH